MIQSEGGEEADDQRQNQVESEGENAKPAPVMATQARLYPFTGEGEGKPMAFFLDGPRAGGCKGGDGLKRIRKTCASSG
jgi:hypothetical protein